MKHTRLILLLLAITSLAFATTVIPVPVERLAQMSSHIVLARAVDAHSEWNAEHTLIYTYTRFQVVRQMKGSLPQTFTVKQIGGHAGGYAQKVSGVRYWQAGEDAVLFLRPTDDGGLTVTGLMQGDFRLNRQRGGEIYVSNGVPETSALSEGAVTQYRGTRMTLSELEQRIRKAGQ